VGRAAHRSVHLRLQPRETVCRYLTFVEPLLSQAQLATTRAAVEQFRSGAGPQLQEHLVSWDKANKGTSYISAMWYDMYLENRDALPLNLTPQLTWLDHPVPEKNDQATRAADLIHAAARFHLTLEAEKLDPDIFHTKPEVSRAPWFQQAVATLVPRKVAWYAGACGPARHGSAAAAHRGGAIWAACVCCLHPGGTPHPASPCKVADHVHNHSKQPPHAGLGVSHTHTHLSNGCA